MKSSNVFWQVFFDCLVIFQTQILLISNQIEFSRRLMRFLLAQGKCTVHVCNNWNEKCDQPRMFYFIWLLIVNCKTIKIFANFFAPITANPCATAKCARSQVLTASHSQLYRQSKDSQLCVSLFVGLSNFSRAFCLLVCSWVCLSIR